jgi:hypothetical protein
MTPTTEEKREAVATTTTYRIDFDRIGRNHNVPPFAVAAVEGPDTAHVIARNVYEVALPYLFGVVGVEIIVNLDEQPGTGTIFSTEGREGRVSGTFTVTPTLTTED